MGDEGKRMNKEDKHGGEMKKSLTGKKNKSFIVLTSIAALFLLFGTLPSTAENKAKTTEAAQKVPSPLSVEFKDTRLSVDAKDVTLGNLFVEIIKQTGVSIILLDKKLEEKTVTVSFSKLDIQEAINRINNAAGLGGYGASFRKNTATGNKGQKIVDTIILAKKGGTGGASQPQKLDDEGLKELTFEDVELITNTVDTHEMAVPLKTTYEVSREEIQGGKKTNFEYTIQRDEPIDRLVITKGSPEESVMMSVRYHKIVKELNESINKSQLVKTAKGDYMVSLMDMPFDLVFVIDHDTQFIKRYEVRNRDNDKKIVVNMEDLSQNNSSFSKIYSSFYEPMSKKTISETYIKQ